MNYIRPNTLKFAESPNPSGMHVSVILSSIKSGLDLAGERSGTQLNLSLTKIMINNARQLNYVVVS